MRDRSHWYQSIRRRLRDALRAEGADSADPTLMCKVELGLTLLEHVVPTASALALWPSRAQTATVARPSSATEHWP